MYPAPGDVPAREARRHFHIMMESDDRFVGPLAASRAQEECEFRQVTRALAVQVIAVLPVTDAGGGRLR